MQTQTHSSQFLRKRRFFLLLPLLVLPFTSLLFWALGGGKASNVPAGGIAAQGGLNLQLPDAYLKDEKSLNKLSYYEKAATDSQRLEEQIKSDPYYQKYSAAVAEGRNSTGDTAIFRMPNSRDVLHKGLQTSTYENTEYADPIEARVYRKLGELNMALNQGAVQTGKREGYSGPDRSGSVSVNSADIDRLERMMNRTRNEEKSEDPEIKQLSGFMDKILDIQHPDRVKEKSKQKDLTGSGGDIYAVEPHNRENNASFLYNSTPSGEILPTTDSAANGFFSLVGEQENSFERATAIQAVVHETQNIVDGAVVKLRLTGEVVVNGTLVPKGSFVFGTASLNGERLNISINNIRYQGSLFPVQLSVVDMDGIGGVYVPGAITRDVAKNAAYRAVQSMAPLDPSWGAQAASAGIEAAKTLMSKKAKLIKVTLKAGYQVLLRDDKGREAF